MVVSRAEREDSDRDHAPDPALIAAPNGPSLKLRNPVERKGLEVLG